MPLDNVVGASHHKRRQRCGGGPPVCRTRGPVHTRMKRLDAKASLLLGLGLVVLAGCGDLPWQLDAFKLNGPLVGHGPGAALDYPTLMRVGAAAEAGGDYPTAVTTYRRAAAV